MKVTFKAKELEGMIMAINELSNKDFPAVVAWDLVDIMGKVDKEKTTFETVKRKIYEKYGYEEKDKDGKVVGMKIKEENFEKAQEELEAIYEKDIEIEVKDLIKKDLLKDVNINLKVLYILRYFFKD